VRAPRFDSGRRDQFALLFDMGARDL
jgi:hypothetical protein